MWKEMLPAFRMALAMTVLTGMLYPGLVTLACQAMFPWQANGSLLEERGKVRGSALIGQNFTRPEYFHPRPSAAGSNGYDASASGGSNLGPTSQKLVDRVKAGVKELAAQNPEHHGAWPADLATASASGLDPHVSPGGARVQAARVAAARGVPRERVEALVARFTEARDLGFLGEPRLNVLRLNNALDQELRGNVSLGK